MAGEVVLFAAIAITATFLVLVVLAFTHADRAKPDHWDHIVDIFEVLSPIAGLAVGFLFGKEVHRKEAETAKDAARRNEHEAKRGHALASAVRTATAIEAGDSAVGSESSAAAVSIPAHWKALREEVETLFPEYLSRPKVDDDGN